VQPNDLVRGLVGLKSLESNRELQNLARQAARMSNEVQCLLIEGDDQSIRSVLSTSEEGQTLINNVDAFLSQYGFLSSSGTDFSRTPWVEEPTGIWSAIGRNATRSGKTGRKRSQAVREEAQRRIQANINWIQRIFFDRLLKSTITHIRLREKTSFLIAEDSFEMRRVFLSLADKCVAQGKLDARDDIFYLTYDELKHLADGELSTDATRRLIATRRAEMEADAQLDLPDTICGDYVPTSPILEAGDQKYLVGIAGSSGLAEGRARVVLDPAAAPVTLTEEDILIVPFTDVSWTPLFVGIGGVVAETGGQLSHSAIVAREYGLPAVVNVKNATRVIKDKQPLMVDGHRGRVYLR
jgi:pyruvate,water dikinase